MNRTFPKNISDWARCDSKCLLIDYRSNNQLNDDLLEMADMFSNIAMPFVIGLSTKQSPLLGLRISRNVRQSQDTLKPLVRLVSNIAGDETTGRELLVHFALHLLYQYNKVNHTLILLKERPSTLGSRNNKAGWYNRHRHITNHQPWRFPTISERIL